MGKILGLAGPVGSGKSWGIIYSFFPISLPSVHSTSFVRFAGKSTLLLALLGELGEYDPKVVNIGRGCLAYASQEVIIWLKRGRIDSVDFVR